MIGAVIGDIVGSVYEFNNIKTKAFEFFRKDAFFTDDTVMTIAVGKAIYDSGKDIALLKRIVVPTMQKIGRRYPGAGYGGRFYRWMYTDNPQPYHSYGNGAAMRVSAAGLFADSIEEAQELSKIVTEVSHNHPEGLKGAEATAVAVYMAKQGYSKRTIREQIEKDYYTLDFTLDEIRPTYMFNETSQNTVPQALVAFFEAEGFEDAVRNAISIGGDSDTLATIAGSVAASYYGVPLEMEEKALSYLDDRLLGLYEEIKRSDDYGTRLA